MKHPYDALITWGRCRDGNRWLWTAFVLAEENEHVYGWTDTESEATERGQAAAFRLATGLRAHITRRHGEATELARHLATNPTTEGN